MLLLQSLCGTADLKNRGEGEEKWCTVRREPAQQNGPRTSRNPVYNGKIVSIESCHKLYPEYYFTEQAENLSKTESYTIQS